MNPSTHWEQTLLDAGVPVSLAQKAGQILEKDDPFLPNLGRSAEEIATMESAAIWVNAQRNTRGGAA